MTTSSEFYVAPQEAVEIHVCEEEMPGLSLQPEIRSILNESHQVKAVFSADV